METLKKPAPWRGPARLAGGCCAPSRSARRRARWGLPRSGLRGRQQADPAPHAPLRPTLPFGRRVNTPEDERMGPNCNENLLSGWAHAKQAGPQVFLEEVRNTKQRV